MIVIVLVTDTAVLIVGTPAPYRGRGTSVAAAASDVGSATPDLPAGDDTSGTLPGITPAVPGSARVVGRGPAGTNDLALTFDDGDCERCVAGVVAGVEQTGAHVTFCPNGVYGPATWDKYAERIKALIARGQVTICNHTWDHKDLLTLTGAQVRAELNKNEQWIEHTFGVSARPFFRPPYGRHDAGVDRIAAQLGYTFVLMWTGTLGDSIVQAPDYVLNQMRMYAKPGVIILGHVNHPATASVFEQLAAVARQAGLRLVTAAELEAPPPALPVAGAPARPGG